jgi:hypothetical protein
MAGENERNPLIEHHVHHEKLPFFFVVHPPFSDIPSDDYRWLYLYIL